MIRRTPYLTLLPTVLCLACGSGVAVPAEPDQFEMVGVIEGFYGTPWSHQDRLDMLAFMGRVGLRDYIYAPKDDPFHLARWQEPYPAEELRALEELVRAADAHEVVFWYAVSPGLSMQYSSDEDYASLLDKIESVAAIGVSHFGLFVDDVPTTLTHEPDIARFPDLAAAHVQVTNRLHTDLSAAGYRLIFTPTTYSDAWGDLDYVAAVGAGVHPDVPIVWTGPDVASPAITADTARAWGRRLQRPPLLWDNFPVNDYARWRLFLGPLTGRDPGLARETFGIIANPMNEAHASMIALHTVAAYAAAPAIYDPQRAYEDAIADLLGPAAEGARPLLEVFGNSGWDDNVFEPLHFLADTIALTPIRTALERAERALVALEQSTDPFPRALHAEAAPIVTALAARVQDLTDRPDYALRSDTLWYTAAQDRVDVPTLTATVDGALDEWTGVPVITLQGDGPAPRLQVGADDQSLYLAVEVTSLTTDVRTGTALPQGDHVAIILHPDRADPIYAPTDPVLLAAPPEGTEPNVLRLTMNFEGFMAKWLRDNRRLQFTEFHVTTFGRALADSTESPVATRQTPNGYVVEAALPHGGRATMGLSVTVADRRDGRRRIYSLQHRPYPINPATYAVLVRR